MKTLFWCNVILWVIVVVMAAVSGPWDPQLNIMQLALYLATCGTLLWACWGVQRFWWRERARQYRRGWDS